MKKLFILLHILYRLAYVLGQLPENPCPDNFIYEQSDEYGTVGRVTFEQIPAGAHEVSVEFSQTPPAKSTKNFTISVYHNQRSLERRLRNGDPVSFRVLFPTPGVLPKVTSIALDDQVLCTSSRYPEPSTTLQVQKTITNSEEGPSSRRNSSTTQRAFAQRPFPNPPKVANDNEKEDVGFKSPNVEVQPTVNKTFDQALTNCGREGSISDVPHLVPLILGGDDIEPGQFPWLAAIKHRNSFGGWVFRCGGTLITPRLVVTAAHCLVDAKSELVSVRVELGRHNIDVDSEANEVYIPTAKSVLNPDYLKHSFPDADIGLIVLSDGVRFTDYIRPICLWTGSDNLEQVVGNSGVVVGWGIDESGRISEVPKMISVPVVSELECRKNHPIFFNLLTERTLCAGKLDGSGPLKGDSGGALMIKRGDRWMLRGIVSVGLSRSGNERHTFVIYCDVAKFTAWIREEISRIT